MGQGAPRSGGKRCGQLTSRRQTTIAELEDWEKSGAVWRAIELSDDHAVIDLCTCTGELMERVESDDQDLIAFVRAHPDE